jgi:hypothetical protein
VTTLASAIESAKRHLYSGEIRDQRDRVTEPLTSSETGIDIEYGVTGIQAGATIAIDLEEMYVWRTDTTGKTATVSRGDGGSTAASHSSASTIYVNPKFSAFEIANAINEDLAALPSEGIYRVATVDLTYDAGIDAYDLTGVTDLLDVLDVEFYANDGRERWSTIPRIDWRLRRDMPTSSFASGMNLTVNGYAETGQTMRVAYKAGFSPLTELTQTFETNAGLHASAHDIPVFGAVIRLIAGAEVSRNFLDQGDTRRADEVPGGARSAMIRNLAALRAKRIEDEKARLYMQRPVMR